VLSAPVNQLELTFWTYNNSTYSTPTLSVGIMSDPEDFSTYTPLATIEPTTANQWLPFRISFSNYIGTARHIAMAMTDNQAGSVYVDDLSIDIIHSCPTATNVHATNIGSTSADIVWDSSDATEFIFERSFQLYNFFLPPQLVLLVKFMVKVGFGDACAPYSLEWRETFNHRF